MYSNISCSNCTFLHTYVQTVSISTHFCPSKFTFEPVPLVLLDQHLAVRVRIDRQSVQRVQLASPLEQILVHLPVGPPQAAVQDPIREMPRVDQAHGVRSDLLQQLHDRLGPRELDLPHRDGARGEEFRRLLLQRVEGVEPEELVHEGGRLGAEVGRHGSRLQGLVEAFDHEILGEGGAEAPKVDEQAVPAALLFVAVLERFEGEERGSPSERCDDVFVTT